MADFDDQVDWDEIGYWTDRCGACEERCGGTCEDYQTDTTEEGQR